MNKIAIVTGGTSGIGLAAVNALRAKGCTVYALSRHGDIPCDVSDEESAKAAVRQVLEKEGRVDILVNCAGFGISGAAELTPLDMAKQQLDVNLYGTANMVNAVIPAMRQQGAGRIVNTGSVAGFVPIPFQTWYSASKAAVQSYTMAMGNELSPFGITLAAVLPGDTKTGFTAARKTYTKEGSPYYKAVVDSVERMAKDEQGGKSPDTVAAVALKLAGKTNPPPRVAIGFEYKALMFILRFLPDRLKRWILAKMYLPVQPGQ